MRGAGERRRRDGRRDGARSGSRLGLESPGREHAGQAGSTKSPPADSHLSTPVITTARCYKVRTTRCAKDPHVVQATGELVLRGRNLRQGMTVYFPVAHASAGRQRALGAPLRPTNHGLAVTIPAHAATGRIYVAASSRVKSKLYGPIAVLAAPRTPRPPVALAPGPPSLR